MKNITLSVDERLVEEGRRYARAHHTSLNNLLRDILARTVREDRTHWSTECTTKMDAAGGRSSGRKWKREDLYKCSAWFNGSWLGGSQSTTVEQ